MSSVWTVCFIKGNTNSGPVVYTVPPSRTAVVTDVDAYLGANVPDRVARFIDNNTAQTIWFFQNHDVNAADLNFYASWRGRQAFGPGQSFAVASANGPVDFRVTGYFLEGEAPSDLITSVGV